MHKLPLSLLVTLLLWPVASASQAQDIGRVSPATVPLPLPGPQPLPPSRLRADNPWNLPLTGPWRFHLTHGQIVANQFLPASSPLLAVSASSSEISHPAQDAFDGSPDTRWRADSGAYPQWLLADLGGARHVTGVTLTWGRPKAQVRFRVEGGPDGKQWTTLADETAAPGLGDGFLALTPRDVRYVRIAIVGSQGGPTEWASLRECQIHFAQAGQDVVWRPVPDAAGLARADAFVQPGYDDRAWNTLSVPSNWEMLGYSLPTYNSVDDTVGLYRRWVFVPKSYAGRRIYWHFDGALDGAEVFVNGQKAGYHESGYTAFDVDLTGLVKPGQRNLLAVRLSKMTPSVDADTGDFQCMGGIYRDTSLIAVPATHVQDLTVRTPLTHDYRDAVLDAEVQIMGPAGASVGLAGAVVGTDGRRLPVRLAGQGTIGPNGTVTVSVSAPVKSPKLWSAEKPNLYYLVLQLARQGKPVERVEQRFGFREVQIKNDIVLWNGRPIKLTGVCRHDFWPTKGFALTDKQWLRDLTLMKAANINAIRTSHYNHAARFLELCDKMGFYILDEVPFCWINEKNNDPAFAPALLQRAADTLGRDKNRACVLAWSLGNENGVGVNSQTVIDYVHGQDPTRPAFISWGGPWGPKGQAFEDRHYPPPADVDAYIANDSHKMPANFSEQPHIFWQKNAHEYDPGVSDLWSEALIRTWDKIWRAPTILGSFIWEWQNQGIADKNADHTTDFWYGPHHLRQENNKGVVTAFRVPKPEWWIVKMVYSKVAIGGRTVAPVGGRCTVPLTNRYSFTDLKELTCRWAALKGGTTLKSGIAHVACPPGVSVRASFPAPAGMTALRLEFDNPDGTSVTIARLGVLGAPSPAPPVGLTGGGPLAVQDTPDALTVGNAVQQIVFDHHTGGIQSWRVRGASLLTGGPILNLGQGMAGHTPGYFSDPQTPVLTNASVTDQSLPNGSARVTVTGGVLNGVGGENLGTLTCTYDIRPNASIQVGWRLDWTAADTHLWEAGLQLPLPASYSRMQWWCHSFFTDYPAGHLGEPRGTCRAGDTLFWASKRGLHWMTLTDATGAGLELLHADSPLVARARPAPNGVTLFASEEVAGPKDLSSAWVSDHDILATHTHPLTGSFTLAATGATRR